MAGNGKFADDFSLTRVPQEARLPMWEILLVRIGAQTALSQLMLGAALGYGMTFWQAVAATILGGVLLTVISLFLGIAGAKEGLSTSLLARWGGFGTYGSSIISAVIAIGLIGWFGIQNGVFAKALNQSVNGALGLPLSAVITGLFVTLIVVFGFKWLSWTARIAVPGFLLVVSYGFYHVLRENSLTDLLSSPAPGPAIALGTATTMVAGSFMVGSIITPDMGRYCRSNKDMFWIIVIGTFIGELGVNIIGILLAHAARSSDVLDIMLKTTGWLGAAIGVLATVKINDFNLYSSSLSITNVIDTLFKKKVNRGLVTLIIGLIGTVLSAIGILGKFQGFLVFLGVWIPPVAGIILVDYFILKTSRNLLDATRPEGKLPASAARINPIALVAWIVGFLVGYFVQFGIPSITSLLVSSAVYYVGMLLLKRRHVVIVTEANHGIK
ncbi:cytosine permease [Paenibacillus beijingensis]|uniref:Allantoin permease n=1 Tax=Paenibacillus beijingensis TaxID=1126833 RepID=A0A0D5NJN1_9BACL|nr:cytosine permease [Paenibacillus beijingensis]AJY75192.1 allantoin permease [Paenibacillus beijingensis]